MNSLFHNMRKEVKSAKSIDLNDGVDRRITHLQSDIYGFEQDLSNIIEEGVIKFKVTSGELVIIDPNSLCNYFNQESKEKDIIHAHGIVISQHGCSGLMFAYEGIHRLFNFGCEIKGRKIHFTNEIINPVSVSSILKYEPFESPFSNQIDTDVCYLAILDYTKAVRSIMPKVVRSIRPKIKPKYPVIKIKGKSCEIGYEIIGDNQSPELISAIDSFEQSLSLYIKDVQ
jgi:hypothetical protein